MKQYIALRNQLAANHSKKIANPKSRPVKAKVDGVTYTGFQYMLKETPYNVVCSGQFTLEDLDELHQKSLEHVDELKNCVYHKLVEKE